MNIDTKTVSDIIRRVAAAEILPRFKNLKTGEVREKNPGDFVTIADEAAEKALTEAFSTLLPGSLVVGEEAVAKDATVVDRLQGDAPVWVLDPVDGTYSFAHGIPRFGVIVSLVQQGVTQYGWIYDVPGDRMAVVAKGKGAAIEGKPARMRKDTHEVQDMEGFGGDHKVRSFEAVGQLVGERDIVNSSFYEFTALAAGEADFLVHVNRLSPWDHAAPVLFLEEAGGYVALSEGGKPLSYHPAMLRPCTLFGAADETRWRAVEENLRDKIKRK